MIIEGQINPFLFPNKKIYLTCKYEDIILENTDNIFYINSPHISKRVGFVPLPFIQVGSTLVGTVMEDCEILGKGKVKGISSFGSSVIQKIEVED